MASAQVMSMPSVVSTIPAAKETEDAGATQQDVYVKLKSLQKHMEFLDIQVGAYIPRLS